MKIYYHWFLPLLTPIAMGMIIKVTWLVLVGEWPDGRGWEFAVVMISVTGLMVGSVFSFFVQDLVKNKPHFTIPTSGKDVNKGL